MQQGNHAHGFVPSRAAVAPRLPAMPGAVFRYRSLIATLYLLIMGLLAWVNWAPAKLPPPSPTTAISPQVSRDSLAQKFWKSRQMLLVYGSGDAAVAKKSKAFLEEYATKWEQMDILVRADTEVTPEDLAHTPIFIIGHPEHHSLLRKMMPDLPFSMQGDLLKFNGKQFRQRPTISISLYPNPLQPEMPVNVLCGTDMDQLLSFVATQNPYWYSVGSFGYQIKDNSKRVVVGFFDQAPDNRWKIGGDLHWDYSDAPVSGKPFASVKLLQHDKGMPEEQVDSVGASLEAQFARAKSFLKGHGKAPSGKVDVHLYASTESKGMMTGNTHRAHAAGGAIYLAVTPEFSRHPDGEPLKPLLRRSLGKAAMPLLETGLSIRLTDDWQCKGWAHWAALLHWGGNAIPLRELLDKKLYKRESPLVKGCLSAALIDHLIAEWGAATFCKRYGSWKPSPAEIRQLEKSFGTYLDALVAHEKSNFPARRGVEGLPAYHKGFNFAHEGYQIFNGYISTAATKALAYTADDLYCNTTAIIPYTGMPNPDAPSFLGFADGAGTENDESVVHCIYGAHQAQLTAMLKPQVWLYRGWPGSVNMKSDADWQAFFDYYYRWMRHYALLGEMHGADVLCTGVEFQEATLARPDDWRRLIRQLRKIYSGPVTYAANWGREFEQMQFWDEVDFIGLNCYYPLSNKENATDAELDRGFEDVMNKVAKVAKTWKKQVVFTEIGFPSLAAAWQEPHAESRERAANTEHQARCYAAMIKALKGRDWCDGVYLWKWPAYDGRSRELTRGFTPKTKPAEKMVKGWFRGI